MHRTLSQLSSHFRGDAAPYGAFLDGIDLTLKDSLAIVGRALAGSRLEGACPPVLPDLMHGRSRCVTAHCFGSAA